MSRARERDQSKTFLKYHKELKRILCDALRLKEQSPSLKRVVFYRRFARIKHRLYLWSLRDYRSHHLEKLDVTQLMEREVLGRLLDFRQRWFPNRAPN